LKGRSAKLLLGEFPELKRRYWAGLPLQGAFLGIGYGCWIVGNITDEVLQAYLDHHKDSPNGDENFILA
jgi:putative transposase